MIVTALALFAAAALGGLVLAGKHLRRQDLPISLALIHGAAAALGLILLIAGAMTATSAGGLLLPIVLFVIAALGGFFLLARHLRGRDLPTAGVFIHAGVAIVAFLGLLAAVLRG